MTTQHSAPTEVQLSSDAQFTSLVRLYREAQARNDVTAAETAESAVMELAVAEAAIAHTNVLAAFAESVTATKP